MAAMVQFCSRMNPMPCGRNLTCGYGYGTFGYGYGRKIVKSWPHGGNAAAISPMVIVAVLWVTASVNLPQYGYGRMTKKPMRSYTSCNL